MLGGRRRGLVVLGVVLALAACGDEDQEVSPTRLDVPETVAIGVLPEPLSDAPTLPSPPAPPTTAPPATTAPIQPTDEPIDGPIGEVVSGNRVLLIGDAVLASAAPSSDGLMCEGLVLFGWEAEIDARSDSGLDFADEVLEARLDPDGGTDWDVVALSFGSEVDGSDADVVETFAADLEALLERLAPRPTVLFTLLEVDEGRSAINEVIRDSVESRPNVVIVEFSDAGDDGVALLEDDGVTLTEDGMKRLSIRTAAAFGKAPGESDGECLPSEFDNEEA
jgi:hypothetical protein